MGNKQSPAEKNGKNCIVCNKFLSPAPSFNDYHQVENSYWGSAYEFNDGEYYRPFTGNWRYYCSKDWWEGERKHKEKQQRQEERAEYDEEYREKMENEESLSGQGYEWMKEQMQDLAQEQEVQMQDYESATDSEILTEIMDSKIQQGELNELRVSAFTKQDFLNPQFKGKDFEQEIRMHFMRPPYSGRNFQSNRQKVIQGWLLQIFLTKLGIQEMVIRDMTEDLLLEVQDVMPNSEIFSLTQAMAEVALEYDSDNMQMPVTNSIVGPKNEWSGKDFYLILSQLFQSDQPDSIPKTAGIILMAGVVNSISARFGGNNFIWIRQCYHLLLQHVKDLDGSTSDWKNFINVCQDLVSHCRWKPIDILGFALHLHSTSTSSASSNKLITVLNRILAFQMPVDSFSFDRETIDSALDKTLTFFQTDSILNIDEIMERINQTHGLEDAMILNVKQIVKDIETVKKYGNQPHTKDQLRNLIHEVFLKGSQHYMSYMSKIVYTLCHAVHKIMNWWPRTTQMCSTVIILMSDRESRAHLLEIATGEGKSAVVAMVSTALALQGEYVDVVTSSPVLAKRDSEEWSSYYALFDLTVGYNGGLIGNEGRKLCYQKNIVYGTVSDFSADILRQEFEMDDVRGVFPNARRFDNIIIDEVDQMTLDQGVQFTYLSHQMVGIRQLEPVLAIIWATVQQHIPLKTVESDLVFAGPSQFFFDALVQGIDPDTYHISSYDQLIALAESHNLVSTTFGSNVQSNDMSVKTEAWKEFDMDKMKTYIRELQSLLEVSIVPFISNENGKLQPAIDDQTVTTTEDMVFILLLDNGMACPLFEMDEIALAAAVKVKETIHFTKSTTSQAEDSEYQIKVPGFLETYTENRLQVFVESAFMAMTLTEGRDYVVSAGNVFPVDFRSTGVIETSKKWGDGLQQFIELKHFCAVSSLSIVTNFMSNQAFFKRYSHIFGVSGTLGGTAELDFLKEHYRLIITKIPTYQDRKLYIKDMEIVNSNKEAWSDRVCDELKSVVSNKPWGEAGRAALVICEDIKTAEDLYGKINEKSFSSTYIYTKNDEAGREVLKRKYGPGSIIVATNLAGRGTNVKVTDDVNISGGLFVLVTFIPTNKRVGLQAFGRTARKGAPGSAALIAHRGSLAPYYVNESPGMIVRIRDTIEENRINRMSQVDIKEVNLREELFSQYCDFLRSVYKNVKGERKEEITLSSLNETWGIWLQMQSEKVALLQDNVLKSDLRVVLSAAKAHIDNNESPSKNVYHTIRFANELVRYRGDQQPAIDHFTKAISLDDQWSSIAYYNRARCLIQQNGNNNKSRAHDDLIKAGQRLKSDIESAMAVYQIIMKTKTGEEQKYFSDQCMQRQEIVNAFKENIEAAQKKLKELIDGGHEATIDATAVFHIIPNAEPEDIFLLMELEQMGLEKIYQIKKKPKFNINALIVTLLGVLQIVAGAILVATGVAVNFGMGLITEGVSDMIEGIKGMITGSFSLVEWAIDKAVSIAISIVTAGVGKAIMAAKKLGVAGIKLAIKSGAQSLKTAIKGGVKQGFKAVSTAVKGSFKETFKHVSKTGWRQAVKANMKLVGKHVGKEVALQGAQHLVNYGLDTTFDKIMVAVQSRIQSDIKSKFRTSLLSGKLRSNCDKILLINIPDSYLNDNLLPELVKKDFLKLTATHAKSSVNMLVKQSKVGDKLGGYSKEVLINIVKKSEGPKGFTYVIEAAYEASLIARMVTESVMLSNDFEDVFNELVNHMLQDQKAVVPSRTLPPVVVDFKGEIADQLSKTYSTAMASIIKNGISSTIMKQFKKGIGNVVTNVLGNKILKMDETKDEIAASGFAMDLMFNNPQFTAQKLTKKDADKFTSIVKNTKYSGSLLDMRIASEKFKLDITIVTEDRSGKRSITGSVGNSGDAAPSGKTKITFLYKTGSDGHTKNLFVEDVSGKIYAIPRNDIFQAIAKGRDPNAAEGVIVTRSQNIRNNVATEVNNNTDRWSGYVNQNLNVYSKSHQRLILLDGTDYTPEDPFLKALRLLAAPVVQIE